jgi:hypothetical protein
VLALERQLNEIRATQTAIAEQLGIYAVIPDISIYVRSQPSYGAAGLELVRAPAKLRVIRTNDDLWVEVESPSGIVGWIDSKLVTFEGDAKVLPPELRYRVTSSRNDLPFIDGRVVSYGGAQGDYLLRDPNNEMSGFLWVPVGTEVTVLNKAGGSHSYGSGLWYLVFLVDPNGQNKVYIGWLPMEVIEKR